MDSTTVSAIHTLIIEAFLRVQRRELATLDCSNHPDLSFGVEELLVFSLPALHAWVDPDGQFDFRVFQRALYQGDLNHQLTTRGLKVELLESVGHLAGNRYRLVRTDDRLY